MVRLRRDHVDRLALSEAVSAEMSLRRKELSSDVAEWALKDHEEEFAEQLRARCLSGFEPTTAEVVWASKGRLRFRPISALTAHDRCVYRALVSDVVSVSEDAVPPFDDFSEFERAPLEDESTEYVAFADVTAFYQYVDHGLIESRIVESTALPDSAEALRGFLDNVFGREFGLPQGPVPSDSLAELVLAPIERTLRRAGYFVSRYSDDFRIGLASRGAASAALELLAKELMKVGLVLNEEKSKVLHRNVYEERVGTITKSVADLFTRLHTRIEKTAYGSRGTASSEGIQTAEAEEEIAGALERLGDARRPSNPTRSVIDRRVALLGLPRLAAWKSLRGLETMSTVVALDPSLSRPYGRHLRVLARKLEDVGPVQEALERVIARLGLDAGPWQKTWLLEPMLDGRLRLTADIEAWTKSVFSRGVPDVLKARALQVLAVHERVTLQETLEKLENYNEASHPDVVAAAAVIGSDSQGDAPLLADAARDDILLKWVVEAIDASGTDLSWL